MQQSFLAMRAEDLWSKCPHCMRCPHTMQRSALAGGAAEGGARPTGVRRKAKEKEQKEVQGGGGYAG